VLRLKVWLKSRGTSIRIQKHFSKILITTKPLFITSAKMEAEGINEMLSGVELSDKQLYYEPEGAGHSGSMALWEGQLRGAEYGKPSQNF